MATNILKNPVWLLMFVVWMYSGLMGGERGSTGEEGREGGAYGEILRRKRRKEEGQKKKRGKDTPHRQGRGQECLGPRCGPHRFPDSTARRAFGLMELGQAARKLCHPIPPFLSSRVSFQQTLRNLGSVGQETLGL